MSNLFCKRQSKDVLEKCKRIKKEIFKILESSAISYEINGDQDYCISNTINICLHGVSSEALMLSSKQYCGVSNGSACNSNSYNPSYVLTAMGVPVEQIENSIRISWGPESNLIAVKENFSKMLSVAKKLVF